MAFLLPALHSLLTSPPLPRGQVAILVLSPTRELALQIAKECALVTALIAPRLECHTAYGGTNKERELKAFAAGDAKVVVATPGRLNDILSDPAVAQRFSRLRTLVLDEADAMLDAGFLVAINDILRRLPPKAQGWQGMCFSATVPKKIEAVLPKVLLPNYIRLSTIDPDETPTIDRVPQHSIIVPSNQEIYTTLYALLQKEHELSPDNFKVIVFGATANGVALMAALLSGLFSSNTSPQIFQLQSRLSQNVRTRTTNEFKEASSGIMLASDVIGRGMDFPNVGLVVQVGLPSNGDQYVHRVGRTARAGNEGRAVILLTQRESFFLAVNKRLPITPYSPDLTSAAQAQFSSIESAFDQVDEVAKAKAYQAWLGFHKTFTKQLRLSNDGLVEQANEYAASMGCPEPPMIDKRVVGKMGLRGVKGLNVGLVDANRPAKAKPSQAKSNGGRVAKPAAERGGKGRGRRGNKS